MTVDQPSAPSSSTATAETRRQLEEWAEAKRVERAARLEKAKEAQPQATALTSGAPTPGATASEAAPAPTASASSDDAPSAPPADILPPASSMSIASLREELLTKQDASVVLGAGDDRNRLVAALEASRRSQGRAGAACILSGRGGGPAPGPDAVRGASWEGAAEEEAEATAAVEGEVLEEVGGPATTAGRAPGDGRDVEEGVPPTVSVFDGGPAPRPTPAGHPPHVRDDRAKHNDDGKEMGVIILVLLVLSFVLSFVPGGIVPYIAGVCSIVALVLVSSIACKCCCAVSYDLQPHVQGFMVGALLSLATSFVLSIVGAVIVVNNNSEITPGVMALVGITLVLNVFAIAFTALFVWGRDDCSLDRRSRRRVGGSLSARAAPIAINGNADSPGEDGPEVAEERWAKRHQWKIVGGAVLAVGAVAVALGVAFGTGGSKDGCFVDRDELKAAVDAYTAGGDSCRDGSNECEVIQTYGWPIGTWCVSDVTDMSSLFSRKGGFTDDLSSWDTSKVTDMSDMFYLASAFNRDVSNWDTSSVTTMAGMFASARSFDGDVSNWNTSSVTNMIGMFYRASSFNRDVSNWDVSSVKNMFRMFYEATAFNQNLCSWGNAFPYNSAEEIFYSSGCTLKADPQPTQRGPFCASTCSIDN